MTKAQKESYEILENHYKNLVARIDEYIDAREWYKLFLNGKPDRQRIKSHLVGKTIRPYHLFSSLSREEALQEILSLSI